MYKVIISAWRVQRFYKIICTDQKKEEKQIRGKGVQYRLGGRIGKG